MKCRSCVLPWLFILLCTLCCAKDPSPSPSPDPPPSSSSPELAPLGLLVLGILIFIIFIYIYNKKQEGRQNLMKISEIPSYITPGLKKGNQGERNKASESMEPPNSISVNPEEKFSSEIHSMEFKPPKLKFIEKDNPSPFVVEELLRASAELLGQGFSGNVYRVVMDNGAALVVKRLKDLLVKGKEFEKRMAFMGSLKHPNVLPIFAYCSSPEENLVIYQYQKKGSLASLLDEFFKGQSELKWNTRLSIIKGVATGLAFMHRVFESQGSIPHGNLKPSNVILSETLEPHIADYGFNSLVEGGTAPIVTPFSSNAYRAPERRITQKSDVYSFGLMLLELLTGKKADNAGFNLPRWVQSTVREEWTVEVFDKEVVRNAGESRIVQLLQLGLNCVSRTPEMRPTISYASDVIDKLWEHEEDNNSFDSSLGHSITELPGGGISMATPSPIRNQSVQI